MDSVVAGRSCPLPCPQCLRRCLAVPRNLKGGAPAGGGLGALFLLQGLLSARFCAAARHPDAAAAGDPPPSTDVPGLGVLTQPTTVQGRPILIPRWAEASVSSSCLLLLLECVLARPCHPGPRPSTSSSTRPVSGSVFPLSGQSRGLCCCPAQVPGRPEPAGLWWEAPRSPNRPLCATHCSDCGFSVYRTRVASTCE